MVETRSFMDLHEDMVELLKLFTMISHYRTLPEGARELLNEAWSIVEDWRDWAKETDEVLERLDELARAELETNYEKYFSVVQEDEENQIWVPLEEVYEAVMMARHEVMEQDEDPDGEDFGEIDEYFVDPQELREFLGDYPDEDDEDFEEDLII